MVQRGENHKSGVLEELQLDLLVVLVEVEIPSEELAQVLFAGGYVNLPLDKEERGIQSQVGVFLAENNVAVLRLDEHLLLLNLLQVL